MDSDDEENIPRFMRSTKSKREKVENKDNDPLKYEQTMRSKSPVKDMFNRKTIYKINDDELPNGKFNVHVPKNKTFAQQSKFLDNDITEETPDENELN